MSILNVIFLIYLTLFIVFTDHICVLFYNYSFLSAYVSFYYYSDLLYLTTTNQVFDIYRDIVPDKFSHS